MIKRDFYNAVINGEITDEVIAQAKVYIESLDKTNANRRAKKNIEQSATDEKVIANLTTEYRKASEIANALDMSTSKVVASLKRLIDEEKVVFTETRTNSKIVKAYALAESE